MSQPAKYRVFAGCESEGTILQGQPYSGPIDPASLAAFALATLRKSPYARSDTAYGLAELDWESAENAGSSDSAIYLAYDAIDPCTGDDCDSGECVCVPHDYWVSVELA